MDQNEGNPRDKKALQNFKLQQRQIFNEEEDMKTPTTVDQNP